MGKKATGDRSEKPDGRGGRYRMLPDCLLKSEAYRTTSFREKAALMVLMLRHTGFNNGSIALSADDLAYGLDCQNHAANRSAVAGLISRGIVEMMRDYPRGSRLAREYRLTFVPTQRAPATHEYLAWQTGDAGTRRKNALRLWQLKHGLRCGHRK